MSDRPKEFFIEYSVKGASGKVTVIGRCGDEPISTHTNFLCVYRNVKRQYPHGLEAPAVREKELPIDVTVEAITAYGKERDELPAGFTGCLIFDGARTDMLPGGWVMSSENGVSANGRHETPSEVNGS